MDVLRQCAASEIRGIERANLGYMEKRVCASGGTVNSAVVVYGFKGVSPGRSGSTGEDEVDVWTDSAQAR